MNKFSIKSKTGFYIGDICYVLNDDVYHGVWGGNNYEPGEYEVPQTGMRFAVVNTAFGDGCYYGIFGAEYGVDAGCIGIVPLELCEDTDRYGNRIEDLGSVIRQVGKFYIEEENGLITITDETGEIIDQIETGDMWDDGYDDDYDEYEEHDEDEW